MGEEGLISRVLRTARRRGLHLCASDRWSGNRPRPGLRAHTARPLPPRTARPGHAHLRRGRQSHRPLAFAAHARHRLPPRKRQRRHAAAQGEARSTICSPSSAICLSTVSPSPCRSSRKCCRTWPTWTRSPPASAHATRCAPAPTASSTASIPMWPASSARWKSACAQGCAHSGSRRRRRSPRSRLRPRGAGRGGLHRQPHPREGRGPRTQGQSHVAQAGTARQKQV
jgi:hypothetical protein